MKKFINLFAVVAVSISLVACGGKTESEKAQDEAKDLVSAYNSLAEDIRTSIPNDSSTTAEINAFEAKVDRLDRIQSRLADLNGTNGVSISSSGSHTKFVNACRTIISSLRAKKANKSQTAF